MNEFEQQLRDVLSQVGTCQRERGEILQKEIVAMYEDRLKKVQRRTQQWLWLTVGVGGFGGVLVGLGFVWSTGLVVLGAAMVIIAIEFQTLFKLWYWQMNTKLSLLRELKELRLAVTGQNERHEDEAEGQN